MICFVWQSKARFTNSLRVAAGLGDQVFFFGFHLRYFDVSCFMVDVSIVSVVHH
jgi:hypothetical protein